MLFAVETIPPLSGDIGEGFFSQSQWLSNWDKSRGQTSILFLDDAKCDMWV